MSDSFDEKVIEAVRKRSVLYNITLCGYKDINVKENAWRKVAEEVGKTGILSFYHFIISHSNL